MGKNEQICMLLLAEENSFQFFHIWLQEKNLVHRPSDLSDFKTYVLFPENDTRNFLEYTTDFARMP